MFVWRLACRLENLKYGGSRPRPTVRGRTGPRVTVPILKASVLFVLPVAIDTWGELAFVARKATGGGHPQSFPG